MSVSQTEDYFENPYCFLEENMLFWLALKWKKKKKAFYSVKAKTNPSFAVKLAERSNIYFYYLFDE